MIFLTSDTHAGHANIIHFGHRPFANVEEMNATIIDRWNAVVGENDHVYHLGDFALGNKTFIRDFLSKLNGHIHLILGNHDHRNIVGTTLCSLFEEVTEAKVIKYKHRHIFLSHYPYLCWPGTYESIPQFHGHVHLRPEYTGADLRLMADVATTRQYDVGVDLNNFTPISIDEALGKIAAQEKAQKNAYHMWCQPSNLEQK